MSSGPSDYAKRKARLTDKGLCFKCVSRPAVPGKTRCTACNEKDRARNAQRPSAALAIQAEAVSRRQEEKLRRPTHECLRCFEVHAPGDDLCHDCRRVQDELAEERRKGLWQ